MLLDELYQHQIPADSVVLIRMPGHDRGSCRLTTAQGPTQLSDRLRFLEIDTTVHGRCFETPNCSPLDTPIQHRAVLKTSYRLWCGEEDLFCSGVYEFFEKDWWQKWNDRVIEFAVMDIGVVYLELGGAMLIVGGGVATLILFLWRRNSIGVRRTTSQH